MPELPGRPALDQLRRQARELLRAAAADEPRAVTRLRAVSERVTLSAAQLAVAREYGYRNWAVLKDEVERRRLSWSATSPPSPDEEWRSFAGAVMVNAAAGVVLPEALLISPGRAVLTAGLIEPSAPESFRDGFADVTVADDRGARYALLYEGASKHSYGPLWLRWLLEPTPGPGVGWIELRGRDGSAARLLPSPRPALRIGAPAPLPFSPAEREVTDDARMLIRLHLTRPEAAFEGHRARVLARSAEFRRSGQLPPASQLPEQLARLCAALTGPRPADGIPADGIPADGIPADGIPADGIPADGIPAGWSAMLDAVGRVDGPRLHLGLGAVLPPLDDVTVQVDSLVSQPDSWRLYTRGTPTWWKHSEDGRRYWSTVSVQAADDLGGLYVSSFGRDRSVSFRSRPPGYDDAIIEFLPRLNPLAGALTLTFRGISDEVAVDVSLPPAARD